MDQSGFLTTESITFGKYKGLSISNLLKDRSYCDWLQKQTWFRESYPHLYERVISYKPLSFFIDPRFPIQKYDEDITPSDFCNSYAFFHLVTVFPFDNEDEKICYDYYRTLLADIEMRVRNSGFNIKAPVRWLQRFEKESLLSRTFFKDVLRQYELPNVTSIVEEVKAIGGFVYKGAKSYILAKNKSKKQEDYWGEILKKKYGNDISVQFKLEHCFFDFLCIRNKTIYECKLSLKDFNRAQYKKYRIVLNKYNLVYLIGDYAVIDLEKQIVFTTDIGQYVSEFCLVKDEKFIEILSTLDVNSVNDLADYV